MAVGGVFGGGGQHENVKVAEHTISVGGPSTEKTRAGSVAVYGKDLIPREKPARAGRYEPNTNTHAVRAFKLQDRNLPLPGCIGYLPKCCWAAQDAALTRMTAQLASPVGVAKPNVNPKP